MSKKVITIAREFGSGGRVIAQKLSEHLGIAFYDKNLISIAAKRRGLPEEKLESGRKICCAGRKRDLFFILRDGVIS